MDQITKALQVIFVGFIVSFFFYPTSFTFLPLNYNSKLILAGIGIVSLIYNVLAFRGYSVNRGLLYSMMLAALYSGANFLSVDINQQTDYSYATYLLTALIWVFGGYGCISLVRWVHPKVTIELMVRYIAGISAAHCILALLIDNFEGVKSAVKSIFYITDFYDEVNRLYSFGVALDPSGVRFSVVLLLISAVLTINKKVQQKSGLISYYLICYIIIVAIGNIISRTTSVGMALSLLVFVMSTGLYRFVISLGKSKLMRTFGIILIIAIPLLTYFYNVSDSFHNQIRYGFEGFFNFFENGEFETSSTNELSTMWVWPTDTKTWIIGSGIFGSYGGGTYFSDIGYCRFVSYSGLIGMTVFSLFFIYNGLYFAKLYPRYRYIFLLTIVLTFVIWAKVATDIFFIYALLFAFVDQGELKDSVIAEERDKLEIAES